ncbi:universal stress protein [Halovenus marina]|uniref:universal stress protein n=1 Tax=Halovenus marina TaxID=3396621 RepID=UPI003F559968
MISTVLVPMDDSEMAERALRFALDAYPDASVTVLHAVGGPSPMFGDLAGIAIEDDMQAAGERHAEAIFDTAQDIAAEYDREVDTAVAFGKPARQILNRADQFDTVVLGSHSGSLADRLFVGNIAKKVVHHSPVPVTTVR